MRALSTPLSWSNPRSITGELRPGSNMVNASLNADEMKYLKWFSARGESIEDTVRRLIHEHQRHTVRVDVRRQVAFALVSQGIIDPMVALVDEGYVTKAEAVTAGLTAKSMLEGKTLTEKMEEAKAFHDFVTEKE